MVHLYTQGEWYISERVYTFKALFGATDPWMCTQNVRSKSQEPTTSWRGVTSKKNGFPTHTAVKISRPALAFRFWDCTNNRNYPPLHTLKISDAAQIKGRAEIFLQDEAALLFSCHKWKNFQVDLFHKFLCPPNLTPLISSGGWGGT